MGLFGLAASSSAIWQAAGILTFLSINRGMQDTLLQVIFVTS
jgi:hypothetical protein